MLCSITVSRTFTFEAAHRLLTHPGKCRHIHGHSYKCVVEIEGPKSPNGMVMDFGVMKSAIGGWIDANWDHNIILNPDDALLYGGADIFEGKAPYIMPTDLKEPTAENLCELLASIIQTQILPHSFGYHVKSVVIEETANCRAKLEVFQVSEDL